MTIEFCAIKKPEDWMEMVAERKPPIQRKVG